MTICDCFDNADAGCMKGMNAMELLGMSFLLELQITAMYILEGAEETLKNKSDISRIRHDNGRRDNLV